MAKAAVKRKPEFQSQHIEIGTMRVENPLWSRDHDGDRANHRYEDVKVNVRESLTGVLASRGLIDAAQARAAVRFRALWEAMGGSGAGAMDYTREPVDGGGAVEPISERQMRAGKELWACRELLGLRGYTLVSRVCGEGQSLYDIGSKRREKDSAVDALRGFLDDLAEMWGYSTRAQRK